MWFISTFESQLLKDLSDLLPYIICREYARLAQSVVPESIYTQVVAHNLDGRNEFEPGRKGCYVVQFHVEESGRCHLGRGDKVVVGVAWITLV